MGRLYFFFVCGFGWGRVGAGRLADLVGVTRPLGVGLAFGGAVRPEAGRLRGAGRVGAGSGALAAATALVWVSLASLPSLVSLPVLTARASADAARACFASECSPR